MQYEVIFALSWGKEVAQKKQKNSFALKHAVKFEKGD